MTQTQRPQYGDSRQPWHPDFVEYMYMIVENDAYSGMPCTLDPDGKIDWSIPSNRPRGSKNFDGNAQRRAWWTGKATDLGISTGGRFLGSTAKAIHPTGEKPCQTCGRVMRIAYVYPRKRTVEKLNTHLPTDDKLEFADLLDIDEVVDHFFAVAPDTAAASLADVFPAIGHAGTASEIKQSVEERYAAVESRMFSPGAMSNAPDRLDGFHSYNLCCRGTRDRGRAAENLRTYNDDRRAFEHWSDGDWSAANYLMTQTGAGPCPDPNHLSHSTEPGDVDLTADHIGPLSLGFAHAPNLQVLCSRCNSAKGNRMSFDDVQALVELESNGHMMTSFQVKGLWDAAKAGVATDKDAALLSKLLRVNQHHYIMALHEARDMPDVLLQFLHPEFASYTTRAVGLDPQTLQYERLEHTQRAESYARSKGSRMVRIAFDALDDYASHPVRNVQYIDESSVAGALGEYRQELGRARRSPSSLRDPMNVALERQRSVDDRTRRLAACLADGYSPDVSYVAVRDAIAALMDAAGEVLAARFARGEAVSWED